jgi:hypothetical protein
MQSFPHAQLMITFQKLRSPTLDLLRGNTLVSVVKLSNAPSCELTQLSLN